MGKARRYAQFGGWLKAVIQDEGSTQKELAGRMGVRPPKVSAWVNGHTRPSPESCDRIAEALKLDVDVVLKEAGHRPAYAAVDEPEIKHFVEMIRALPQSDYPLVQEYLQFRLWRQDNARRSRMK